jgi:hypothetical protein|tara:strand:- start:530 stop:751 length:222 start_codon:yes stop_codon:yes gene_type:complete
MKGGNMVKEISSLLLVAAISSTAISTPSMAQTMSTNHLVKEAGYWRSTPQYGGGTIHRYTPTYNYRNGYWSYR